MTAVLNTPIEGRNKDLGTFFNNLIDSIALITKNILPAKFIHIVNNCYKAGFIDEEFLDLSFHVAYSSDPILRAEATVHYISNHPNKKDPFLEYLKETFPQIWKESPAYKVPRRATYQVIETAKLKTQLIEELQLLPQKYIYKDFPGGTTYRQMKRHFSSMQEIMETHQV